MQFIGKMQLIENFHLYFKTTCFVNNVKLGEIWRENDIFAKNCSLFTEIQFLYSNF